MTTRVLFFSQAPGVGGGERAVLPLLSRLDGIEVLVAAPRPVAAYATSLRLPSQVVEMPRAHRLIHAARVVGGARRVVDLFRAANSDVLYANGTRAIPYAVGAALFGARPLLFHHHGVLERGPVRTLVKAAGHWADAIVVPSRTGAAPFEAAADKVHIVANGIDMAAFPPVDDRADAKAALGLPSDAVVVGTLTRADPSKGMEEFLDMVTSAAHSLPEVHFVVAGGPVFPHEFEPYRRIVERARALGPHVTCTGRVEEAIAFYSATDVFVHLGRPEGFGLTVLEALACGLPVVAYDWGAIPEVFDGLVTLVRPGNTAGAVAAVERFVGDAPLRARTAERGRAEVEARFGADQTAAQLRRVIDSLAHVHP